MGRQIFTVSRRSRCAAAGIELRDDHSFQISSPCSRQLGIRELGHEVVMFHAPSQDSNLKTKGLTLAASLQSNVLNVLKFGSPHWTHFELLQRKLSSVRTEPSAFVREVWAEDVEFNQSGHPDGAAG